MPPARNREDCGLLRICNAIRIVRVRAIKRFAYVISSALFRVDGRLIRRVLFLPGNTTSLVDGPKWAFPCANALRTATQVSGARRATSEFALSPTARSCKLIPDRLDQARGLPTACAIRTYGSLVSWSQSPQIEVHLSSNGATPGE